MQFEHLLFEQQGPIAIVTLNRPAALNALNRATLRELDQVLEHVEGTPSIVSLIITGAGPKSFVAGADISEMQNMDAAQALGFAQLGIAVGNRMRSLQAVIIAAVNGFALGGGCELALACDIILASDNAKFGQPEVNLGVIPGFGGTQRLARRVGPMWAKHLILSAEIIGAEEAARLGLVTRVYPQAQLLAEAKKLASTIAGKGPVAVRRAKEVIDNGLDVPLSEGLALESEAFAACFDTADQKEGMTAFLAKRPAQFKGV
ncbi:MAG: enoyl-CoA hydratase-related protein [Myxococcota bacterium]